MAHVVRHSKRAFLTILLWLCDVSVNGYLYDRRNNWINMHYQCGGCLQSPINLITAYAEKVKLQPLVLNNYDKEDEVKLANDGDNVMVEFNTYLNATVTGGNNEGHFQVEMVLFHWGTNIHTGSEHTINAVRYPFEMQIVHRNAVFSGMDTASQGVNGFLNFAMFFREVANDRSVTPGLKAICASLHLVRRPESSTILNDISIRSLMHGLNMKDYFTYCGSLTVPPCSPNVIWVVFVKPLDIDSVCLTKFRQVLANDRRNMTFNFRQVQATGERKVFYNIDVAPQDTG